MGVMRTLGVIKTRGVMKAGGVIKRAIWGSPRGLLEGSRGGPGGHFRLLGGSWGGSWGPCAALGRRPGCHKNVGVVKTRGVTETRVS